MLSKDEILTIISSELSNADGSIGDGEQGGYLEDSLAYYLGDMPGAAQEGRSQVVSTDVADAIEWIMPQVMKAFTQNNEVVIFDPVHEGDEDQAEIETEYVYEVLMKQNDGFVILHQFIKDALMQNNGILKVYYADTEIVKAADYTGITEQALQQLLSSEGVELVEQSSYIDENQTAGKNQLIQQQIQMLQQKIDMGLKQINQIPAEQAQKMAMHAQQQMQSLQRELQTPITLYDVKVSVTRIKGQVYVDAVPPEEFRLSPQHNSINVSDARFSAHVILKSASEVMQEFELSKEEVDDLPEGHDYYNREYRFNMQGDLTFYENFSTDDDSQNLIEISECYINIDIDQTGISKFMKITVVGGEDAIDILDIEEVESSPFITTTTFLMSHKFKGLSITDRIREVQDQKTAMIRSILDNTYLQNNQQTMVVEGQVNMDDLLVSRPGNKVRVKSLNAMAPLVTPQLGPDAYNMLDYFDKVRAGRTGVSADGGTAPQDIGNKVGSEGVERLMSAKEELVGLIIRVIAETGIKPLCNRIRDLSVKHIDSVVDFRFRGQWQKIKPSEWQDRTQCTVRVGTGTGNHQTQMAALGQIMVIQEKLMMSRESSLINKAKVYSTLNEFCKMAGLNSAMSYFVDPESKEGKAQSQQQGKKAEEARQKEEKMQLAMAQSQIELAKAEQGKAQAQMVSAQSKAESDQSKNQLQLQKQMSDGQISLLKQQLAEAEAIADSMGKTADLDLKKYEIDQRTALELTKIEASSATDQNENFEENREEAAE